jgi:DNA polymerase III sliding clamp (beta) subunit (PCNA family)
MNIPSNTLRDARRLFSRLKHLRCKLPVLNNLLFTAGPEGAHLAATDLDHWLETRISDLPADSECFLIPPAAMEAACRADKGTEVSFTPSGGKHNRKTSLTLQSGGIRWTSGHPTLDPGEFPSRPHTIGTTTEIPPATLRGLAEIAGCASTDITRHILNGVFFTPEEGGSLIATDGKRLACCPATVPPQPFILPTSACHILAHPDFTSDLATIIWIDHEDPERRHVAIQCGRHQLVSKPLVGSYPNYKQVIPTSTSQIVVIPHDRKPSLIAWLRSFGKGQCEVRLGWHKRGQLTLTHLDADGHSATMQVPVEIHGCPPAIAFNANYLADALEIGGTLCLNNELSPAICRHPTGRFCVLMPMRATIPAANYRETHPAGAPPHPQAAA